MNHVVDFHYLIFLYVSDFYLRIIKITIEILINNGDYLEVLIMGKCHEIFDLQNT